MWFGIKDDNSVIVLDSYLDWFFELFSRSKVTYSERKQRNQQNANCKHYIRLMTLYKFDKFC